MTRHIGSFRDLSGAIRKYLRRYEGKKIGLLPFAKQTEACHPELGSGSINVNQIDRFRVKHGMTNKFMFAKQTVKDFSPFTSHFSRKRTAFTKPSRGTNASERRTITSGNRAFRFDCERCRLRRGAVDWSNKKVAFTLAEVLITLGIIGVVAALTMPSLIQKHKELETVAKLKKFSSVMSQALTMAVQNEGEIPNWGLGTSGIGTEESDDELANSALAKKKFLDIVTKYLKYTEYHPMDSEATLYERYSLDGTKFGYFAKHVVLPDGMSIVGTTIIRTNCNLVKGTLASMQNICGELFVDINGKKGPNATGKDVFLFYYNKFGQLIPVGSAAENSFKFEDRCNRSKTHNLNGYGCTAWVIYNENMDYLHCDDLSWNGKHKCK